MSQKQLERQRPAWFAASRAGGLDVLGGHPPQVGLPVVALLSARGLRAIAVHPQGRDGSVLIALAPSIAPPGSTRAVLSFDAVTRRWTADRISLPSAGERSWSFDVPSGDGAQRPGPFEVEPRTGFVTRTDAAGRRFHVQRLWSKRPRCSGPERSLALEILRAPGEAERGPEWIPVARLEGNERWLFVGFELQGISFGIR